MLVLARKDVRDRRLVEAVQQVPNFVGTHRHARQHARLERDAERPHPEFLHYKHTTSLVAGDATWRLPVETWEGYAWAR